MVDAIKLLQDLISLPSVNPAFLQPGDPHAGETGIADFLCRLGQKAGMEVETQEVASRRSNVFLRLIPSGRTRKRVLLAPHLDTVNGTDAQFIPNRAGDRLFGRGACDTKGSLATMFAAMCDLTVSSRRPANTEIVLAALVDEENAQLGSRALARSRLRADLAIIGEPTLNRVVTAHKGNLWIRLETFGKLAHGSRPELGKNAVHEMARIVDLLETHYATGLKKKSHPLLGCATVNVGAISGGTQPNIVPDHCRIQIDRRTLPGETEKGVLQGLKLLLKANNLHGKVSMFRPEECMPLETDPQRDLVQSLMAAAGQNRAEGVHYFCDAAILSHAGIPSVVFGPGDIAQAHTADEWISIRSLDGCRAILNRFLEGLP